MIAAERRARIWLAVGAVCGIALAVGSLLSPGDTAALPADAVARVNGALIRRPVYERAVAGLASDRREPLTPEDRRFVLDRLIDEELLVQYGISLQLARSDRRIRGDFVSAVLGAQVASADGTPASLAELEAFYRENRDFFRLPERLRVRGLWVRAEPLRSQEEALERAKTAADRWRNGDDFEALVEAYGDPEIAAVPDGLLPPAKLREYIGPTALTLVRDLGVGDVSEPVASAGGFKVLRLVEKSEPEYPALADIEREVRNEMTRRAGDEAVRRLLADLRRDGRVEIAEDAP